MQQRSNTVLTAYEDEEDRLPCPFISLFLHASCRKGSTRAHQEQNRTQFATYGGTA